VLTRDELEVGVRTPRSVWALKQREGVAMRKQVRAGATEAKASGA
jgi:hypothetical protein